ncbi:MAG: hypothetical protein ACOC56_03165 [Atribacterota bacterium]
MKISDLQVMDYINSNRFIIITGTSQGRTRMRRLILENIGPKRIIKTRRYYYSIMNIKDRTLSEVYPLYGSTNCNKDVDDLYNIVSALVRKRRPVIVDSFTDVQSIVINRFKDVGKNESNDLTNWNIIMKQLEIIINALKTYKKQLILFCDLKEITEYENGELKHLGYKPSCMRFINDISQVIIQANDDETLLIKNIGDIK